MKQSATDPKTGLIDVNILTTGLSVSDRKRRLEIAKALKELLQSKGTTPTVKYQQTYEELREASDLVSEELWPALIYFYSLKPKMNEYLQYQRNISEKHKQTIINSL